MTFYLRDENNKNVVEIKLFIETKCDDSKRLEISCNIDIRRYSNLLLSNKKHKNKIINDFEHLSEIRGWLWERYFIVGENDGSQMDDVKEKLMVVLDKLSKDYNLALIIN